MIEPVSESENLLFRTVRLEVLFADGRSGIGTGFFYAFSLDENRVIPVIITNKHVVHGATGGSFRLHAARTVNAKSTPSGDFLTFKLENFESHWINHPNDQIDLCAMPFNPFLDSAEKEGKGIFHIYFRAVSILSDDQLSALQAVENVLMVGYPIGLWDEANNLPLIRKGVTASHPAMDFNGQSLGVVDMACFPGSSGSPVIIPRSEPYMTKEGRVKYGGTTILLGVLCSTPVIAAEGRIEVREIPTRSDIIPVTELRIHLGYYVKAKEIKALGEHIVKVLHDRNAL